MSAGKSVFMEANIGAIDEAMRAEHTKSLIDGTPDPVVNIRKYPIGAIAWQDMFTKGKESWLQEKHLLQLFKNQKIASLTEMDCDSFFAPKIVKKKIKKKYDDKLQQNEYSYKIYIFSAM